MKFLHTADWHLGIKTMGKDRLKVQEETMNEICAIAKEQEIDVVIVAGDIYNSSVPSAQAEELFYQTAEKLSDGGNRLVLVVAGNHDDPERLCAGLPLAYSHNIVLAGDINPLKQSRFVKDKPIKVIETGKGYIKVQKGNEIANLAYLPFDSTLKARPNIENISYNNLVGEIAKECAKTFSENEINVFISHLLLVGTKNPNDRAVSIGDVFAVSAESLPKADYTALGHIHTPQEVVENVYYSGSTSKVSPRAINLYVNIVEIENKKTSVKKVKLATPEEYLKIKVNSVSEAQEKLKEFKDRDIIELTIVQSEPLRASEIKQLKKDFPCLCLVELELKNKENGNGSKNIVLRKDLSDKELFKAFYKHKKGIEPKDSLLDLFLKCKGGRDETN